MALDDTPAVSLVTVTFNAAGFVPTFLAAVDRLTYPALEVIVVDNGSTDGTSDLVRRLLPRAVMLAAPWNLGFAAGSNMGAARARGDVVLFLNPDTEPPPGAVQALCQPVWDQPEIGAAGCKLVYPDGRIQSAGGTVGSDGLCPHRGQYELDHGQYDVDAEVDYVLGAALAIRRRLFWEAGGFHDGYFPGFYEDVELCVRLRRQGYRVRYFASPAIVHAGSPSMGRRLPYWLARNRLLFLARNGDPRHRPRGLAREAAWLAQRHLRPFAAALLGAHPWKLRQEWRRLRGVVAGELVGLILGARAARRRMEPARPFC